MTIEKLESRCLCAQVLSPDVTWGRDGTAYVGFIGASGDGLISYGSANDVVQRFNANGTLDTSYQVNHNVKHGFQPIVDQQGRVLFIRATNRTGLQVTRTTTSGLLDTSFGNGGTSQYEISTDPNVTWKLADGVRFTTGHDGSIYFALRTATDSQPGAVFDRIIKIDSDGTRDTRFNYSVKTGASGHEVSWIHTDSQGRLMVISSSNNTVYAVVTRLGTDGRVDRTYGSNGYETIQVQEYPGIFAMDRTDRLYFDRSRLRADGELDNTYIASFELTSPRQLSSNSILPAPDGSIFYQNTGSIYRVSESGSLLISYRQTGNDPYFMQVIASNGQLYATNNTSFSRLDVRKRYAIGSSHTLYVHSESGENAFEFKTDDRGRLVVVDNLSTIYTYRSIRAIDCVFGAGADSVKSTTDLPLKLDLGDGNNHVESGNGNDTIKVGKGNDTVIAGEGDDLIINSGGADALYGGNGNDLIETVAGHSLLFIYGENGQDTILGGSGNSRIKGGRGNDLIVGGSGNDAILAESGNDTIYGGAGDDFLFGGVGNDFIYGGEDDDVLNGDDGDDTIYDLQGSNYIYGGLGRDLIYQPNLTVD